MKNLFLTDRFFLYLGALVAFFAVSFFVPAFFLLAQLTLALFAAAVLFDIIRLFRKDVWVRVRRRLPKVLSLSDENKIHLDLHNKSGLKLNISIIDELPFQLQKRDFLEKTYLDPDEKGRITYEVRPVKRGEYHFGAINLYLSTSLGLIEKRFKHDFPMMVPVYPSIIQMKELELRAFNKISFFEGIKKIRRIGHSYEFEQIKNYVQGDDYRAINWKATGRRATLMVNQYEDERSQQVYSIIDKSRSMRMPFEGLSLMDYAINSTLAISNIILKKHDMAGLITFSDKIGATVKADGRPYQLQKILQALYNEKERHTEANYEILYQIARKLITGRSLIMLYTNFESMYALDRMLPILRKISKVHLLVVIFFENTEIQDFASMEVDTLEDIYHQTVAQNFIAEKIQMVQKLRNYGIQAVLTKPEDLSLNTVNKYLELKARGLI
ncbi:MAG: DUF58 domain-containing protein [Bacteroidetes bacterium]|nr:MAG: DUF58 domain-containing protein [Bacteroidota bacterium]